MTTTDSRRVACVVDGYSTGATFAERFKTYDTRCVHVQSTAEIPDIYKASHDPRAYEACFLFDGDAAALAQRLRSWNVSHVLAGAEIGTRLADDLAERLALPGNPADTSELRRDKFLMGQAVADAGLRAVRQARVSSVDEADALARDWQQWPLVVKPLDSAGSDSVCFCLDAEEVRVAVGAIVGHTSRLGIRNVHALVQERLVGQQYIVNLVSRHGTHHVTEIWRDDRIQVQGAGLVYDREVLLPAQGALQAELGAYACSVLDALDVHHGPSHMEVMHTPSGPCLIEVGARVQGGIDCDAVEQATGESHVSLTTLLHADDAAFANAVDGGCRLRKNIMAVALISTSSGIIEATHVDRLLASLPSFHSFQKRPRVGDHVDRTIDLFTSPGTMYFLHDSLGQLEADYMQLRQWEREGNLLTLARDPMAA